MVVEVVADVDGVGVGHRAWGRWISQIAWLGGQGDPLGPILGVPWGPIVRTRAKPSRQVRYVRDLAELRHASDSSIVARGAASTIGL